MWKKSCNILLLVTGMFVGSSHSMAQVSYTLEELIQQSLDHNYQLQIRRNQQQMAENMNTAGNAGMLPTVDMGAERSWQILNTETNFFTGETRSGTNALNTSFNAFVEADWMIFDGFSMFARRDRLSQLAQLGSLDTRYYIEQTVSDIAHAYFQLIKEKQTLISLKQSLDISSYRLKLEEHKRNVGSGNALLYHQAQIDYNSDSSRVSNQQMLIRDLQIRINRIVNFDPSTTITPEITDIELHGISEPEELLAKALASNQELERAQMEQMLAEANLRIERGNRYPQVSVFGGYSYSRQTSELGLMQSSRNYGANFGVRLRFNLYDGGRQNTRIENVLLEQQNVATDLEDTKAYLNSEISRLINVYENYMQQFRLLENSLQSTERSLQIAQQQLELGTINGFEFRQTQLAALQVENQIIELKFSMKAIEIDLSRISGEIMDHLL